MPKDEFDFDDPLELNGVALYTDEDTSRDMAECFVEEFLMLGYNHKQLLALIRNPHYLGMNMVLQNKGETFVKEVISDVLARWGKKIEWSKPVAAGVSPAVEPGVPPGGACADSWVALEVSNACPGGKMPPSTAGETPAATLTDPLGNPAPKLNL
jgi:hypothetical protein